MSKRVARKSYKSKSSASEKRDGPERHDTDVKRVSSARVAAKNLLFHETNTGFYACSKIERENKKDRGGGRRRRRKNSQRLKPSKIETSCVTAFRGAQKFRRIFVASRFLAGRSGRESVAAESLALPPAPPLPSPPRAGRDPLFVKGPGEIRTSSKGGSTSRGVAARTMIKMELIPGSRPADAHTRLSSITCNHRRSAILSRLVTVRERVVGGERLVVDERL